MSETRRLDRIDISILKALLADGKPANTQLSEKVGLSPSPCWQRVRRLEEEGYISGFAAVLDQAKLGASEIVLVEVMLDHHSDEVLGEFGRIMSEIPEVLEVYLTTGEYDYMIKVAVDGTAGYEEFLRNRLYKVPGIRHTRSSFTLRCLKRAQAFVPEV